MNLVPVLASLFALLFLTALVAWLVLFLRFRHSPEKRWSAGVFRLLQQAENYVRQANRQVHKLKAERDGKAGSLREEVFAALLREYSVDELEAYPGIGPVTIEKLRAEGFVNLASLHRAQIRIPGLGAKRLADIDYAVRNLLGKARSTFDAGNCGQAQELAARLETISNQYDRMEAQARTRARVAEDFIASLAEAVKYARRVTIWRWLWTIPKESLVPAELMEASPPDLEATLRAAEQSIAASEAKVNPTQTVPAGQAQKNTPVSASRSEPEGQNNTQLVRMEMTIQFAYGVARTDGPINETERGLIRQCIRQRFGEDRALVNRAKTLCAHYETAAIDFAHCLGEIKRRFAIGDRTALMELAGQLVAVSGKEAAQTTPFLLRLAQSLDVPPLALPQREPETSPPAPSIAPPSPTEDECRSLLEISAETPLSADLVRRQWNLLSHRLDPERVASMGPEFVKLAQDKRAQLCRAAETLLEPMGQKLEVEPTAPPVQDLRHNPDLDDVFGGT